MANLPVLDQDLTPEERMKCYHDIGQFLVLQTSLELVTSSFIIAWMNATDTPFIDQLFGIIEAGNKKRMLDVIVGRLKENPNAPKEIKAAKVLSATFEKHLQVRNVLAHGLPHRDGDRLLMATLNPAAAFKATSGVDKWVYLDELPAMLVEHGDAFRHARHLQAWIAAGHAFNAAQRATSTE